MSMNEMLGLVEEINEYTTILEEVKEIIADRQDKIKAYMTSANPSWYAWPLLHHPIIL